jgi:hypothetical protein
MVDLMHDFLLLQRIAKLGQNLDGFAQIYRVARDQAVFNYLLGGPP